MIIKGLAGLIHGLLSVVLVFNLPSLPDSVLNYMDRAEGWISALPKFLCLFMNVSCVQYLGVLLGLVIALNGLWLTYSLVMWVIRKIPMLNVKE